jgi:hypothetical protein
MGAEPVAESQTFKLIYLYQMLKSIFWRATPDSDDHYVFAVAL